MDFWKNGMLFGAAGILAGLLISALMDDEDKDEAEVILVQIR